MRTYVLIHGFNVKDGGKATIDKLKRVLKGRGAQTMEADYGYINLFGVRFFNDNIANVIAGMTPNNAIAIAHSNGCALALQACDYGAPFKYIVMINPALDSDFDVPNQVDKILVLHNEHDSVVSLSKWLPFHDWGDAGRVGYKGKDKRVINVSTYDKWAIKGHSSAFDMPVILGEYIKGWIDEQS